MGGVGARSFLAVLLALLLAACGNNPYGEFPEGRVLFTSLDENPATVDPARISDVDSKYIGSNVHDTPFEYHYLKRPLKLVPSMATALPETGPARLDGRVMHRLRFSIQRGLRYKADPCFAATRGSGTSPERTEIDAGAQATREITIHDIVFSIKRAADDSLEPFGKAFLLDKLHGFREFHEQLAKAQEAALAAGESGASGGTPGYADSGLLREAYAQDIAGLRTPDDSTLEAYFYENYPQSLYFFSDTTASPVPPECALYYNGRDRPTYDRGAVASGPFYVKKWREQHRIVLARNPQYRKNDWYPEEGMPQDRAAGLLEAAGKPLPLLDEVRVTIIKRGPPKWQLFGQGYLDLYRNRLDLAGRQMQSRSLRESYREKQVKRTEEIELSSFGWTFQMRSGRFAKNRKLRQAVSLAVDRQELIDLFLPERAVVAHSPIPPGLAGYDESFRNPYSGRDVERAKRLLREAGYADGVDPATGEPLEITLIDRAAQGRQPIYRFYIDQMSDLGIRMRVEQLDFPTMIQKMRRGEFELIHWGWGADYPDPQNFLQLFYGPYARSNPLYNNSGYRNPEFDALYERMRLLSDGPEREEALNRMKRILANDLPVSYLFHRRSHYFTHAWTAPLKPGPMDFREMKYWNVNPEERERRVAQWNRISPFAATVALALPAILVLLLWRSWRLFQKRSEAGA